MPTKPSARVRVFCRIRAAEQRQTGVDGPPPEPPAVVVGNADPGTAAEVGKRTTGDAAAGAERACVTVRVPNTADTPSDSGNVPLQFFPDAIFQGPDQEAVFLRCGASMVDSALDGYNATLLAYGQTGAGKTYTMTGGTQEFDARGISPRIAACLFRRIAEIERRDARRSISVRATYVEVYNEGLYDLLASTRTKTRVAFGTTDSNPMAHRRTSSGIRGTEGSAGTSELAAGGGADSSDVLDIVRTAQGGVTVRGLTRPVLASTDDAIRVLYEGETSRAVASHRLNATSTRSHCIFTLHIESVHSSSAADTCDPMSGSDGEDEGGQHSEPPRRVSSKLHLVDLAGSERPKRTNSENLQLVEAGHINKSLSFLEQCVRALTDQKRHHIPFRQSKLTHMLQDSLGGNCRTALIACVRPEAAHAAETASTLRFASRMQRVACRPVVNEDGGTSQSSAECRRLRREVQMLRTELAMHDMMAGRAIVDHAEPDKETVRRSVRAFLGLGTGAGTSTDSTGRDVSADALSIPDPDLGESEHQLHVHSVRHAQAIFAAFKDVFAECAYGTGCKHDVAATHTMGHHIVDAGVDTTIAGRVTSKAEYLPRVVVAPTTDSATDDTIQARPCATETCTTTAVPSSATATTIAVPTCAVSATGSLVSEKPGRDVESGTSAAAREVREKLRAARAEAKQLAGTVNGIKAEIDAAMEAINRQRVSSAAVIKDELVFEEDQFSGVGMRPLATRQTQNNSVDVELVRTLKNAKQRYRAAFGQLQQAKERVQHLVIAKANARV